MRWCLPGGSQAVPGDEPGSEEGKPADGWPREMQATVPASFHRGHKGLSSTKIKKPTTLKAPSKADLTAVNGV